MDNLSCLITSIYFPQWPIPYYSDISTGHQMNLKDKPITFFLRVMNTQTRELRDTEHAALSMRPVPPRPLAAADSTVSTAAHGPLHIHTSTGTIILYMLLGLFS